MTRRRQATKRVVASDPRHGSMVLGKFINVLMKDGKKSLAERLIEKSFNKINQKFSLDPLEVFNAAIQNVRPFLELNSVRVGGANYQVPSPVDEYRGNVLAIRWIIDSARKRSEKIMIDRLAGELFDAYGNKGIAVKKKEDTHKMAEANKAFAHFGQRRSKSKPNTNNY